MNNPTDDRIKKIEERLDRIEQQTEPINLRIERGLPAPEATVLQTIMDMVGKQGPDIGQLKTDVEGIKADISAIKATLSDHRDTYSQSRKISDEQFKELSDTQDEQGKKLDLILSLLQKGDRPWG